MDDSMEKIEAAVKEEAAAKSALDNARRELNQAREADANAALAFQNAPDSDKERLCKEWARTTKRFKDAEIAFNSPYSAWADAKRKREELVAACD